MERHFEQDLADIRQDMLRMGVEVEQMLGEAMRSLVERDSDAAQKVIERDKSVDVLEKRIDEECHSLLVRYQPAATDLRFLIAVMKIVNDLERVGDCSKNIAEFALVLNEEPPLKPYVDLPRMTQIAREMLRQAMDAFIERDDRKALEVCRRDNSMDTLYEQIFRELLTFMIESPKTVTRALHLLLIAQSLERIADHATNVAEDVVYYLEARDIRHTPEGTGAAVD